MSGPCGPSPRLTSLTTTRARSSVNTVHGLGVDIGVCSVIPVHRDLPMAFSGFSSLVRVHPDDEETVNAYSIPEDDIFQVPPII